MNVDFESKTKNINSTKRINIDFESTKKNDRRWEDDEEQLISDWSWQFRRHSHDEKEKDMNSYHYEFRAQKKSIRKVEKKSIYEKKMIVTNKQVESTLWQKNRVFSYYSITFVTIEWVS